MKQRFYLPTFSELLDRLSIVQLKQIFIPKNNKEYTEEMKLIMADIDSFLEEEKIKVDSNFIRMSMLLMLSNRYIWENESKARESGDINNSSLILTHSINGVRNSIKNFIVEHYTKSQRKDFKIDCLASELRGEFQNWEKIFFSNKKEEC